MADYQILFLYTPNLLLIPKSDAMTEESESDFDTFIESETDLGSDVTYSEKEGEEYSYDEGNFLETIQVSISFFTIFSKLLDFITTQELFQV